MAFEQDIDLGGLDLEAGAIVLDPAGEPDAAGLVDFSAIAGAVPAVLHVTGRGGGEHPTDHHDSFINMRRARQRVAPSSWPQTVGWALRPLGPS
jgi:hypothetical protein